MPWLYYSDNGEQILNDEDLTEKYTFPDSKLNFVVGRALTIMCISSTKLSALSIQSGVVVGEEVFCEWYLPWYGACH